MKRSRRTWLGYGFLAPYLVLFALFSVAPFFYGLALSLLRWEMLSPLPPQWRGLGNFAEALTDAYFWQALWATFRFVLMAVPLTVGLSLLVSLGVNAVPARRQAWYRAAYFLPTLISVSVVGLLWRWFFSTEFGFLNEVLGVRVPWITDADYAMKSIVLMTLWWQVGGPMVILLAALKQIPRHYYEAALIEGATPPQRFVHVTLPSIRPVLLFVVVMNTIASFQVFGQTFMVTRGGPEFSTRVLVQYIYETAFTHYRMGYGAAMSWLLFVIIAVLSLAQFQLMRER